MDFEYSPELNHLALALSQAQGEMENAAKDSLNPHFKSKYADLASIWDACRKSLSKYKLAVIQGPACSGPNVEITTLLVHESGQWVRATLKLTSKVDTPQGIGSTITYGRRYSLASMIGIAPDDDDGEAASNVSRGTIATQTPMPQPVPVGFDPQNTHQYSAVKRILAAKKEIPIEAHEAAIQALKGKTQREFDRVLSQFISS